MKGRGAAWPQSRAKHAPNRWAGFGARGLAHGLAQVWQRLCHWGTQPDDDSAVYAHVPWRRLLRACGLTSGALTLVQLNDALESSSLSVVNRAVQMFTQAGLPSAWIVVGDQALLPSTSTQAALRRAAASSTMVSSASSTSTESPTSSVPLCLGLRAADYNATFAMIKTLLNCQVYGLVVVQGAAGQEAAGQLAHWRRQARRLMHQVRRQHATVLWLEECGGAPLLRAVSERTSQRCLDIRQR